MSAFPSFVNEALGPLPIQDTTFSTLSHRYNKSTSGEAAWSVLANAASSGLNELVPSSSLPTAGSPAQTPSAAIRRARGAQALVDNETSSHMRVSCPSPRAPRRTLMCVEPKHPEPKLEHPVGLPAGSPAQAPSAALRRAPGVEALVDDGASSPIGVGCRTSEVFRAVAPSERRAAARGQLLSLSPAQSVRVHSHDGG